MSRRAGPADLCTRQPGGLLVLGNVFDHGFDYPHLFRFIYNLFFMCSLFVQHLVGIDFLLECKAKKRQQIIRGIINLMSENIYFIFYLQFIGCILYFVLFFVFIWLSFRLILFIYSETYFICFKFIMYESWLNINLYESILICIT